MLDIKMNIAGRLDNIFRTVMEVTGPIQRDQLQYNQFQNWNSLGHMALIAAIETEFDCILDIDDILAMSNFDKAFEIVSKHVVN
jgi:acyl carrier protein